MEHVRRLVPAGGVTWSVAILAAATLAGCGSARDAAPRGQAPRRPALAGPVIPGLALGALANTTASANTTAAANTTAPANPTARAKGRKTPAPWLINPDAPLSRRSPWGPVLTVARRFAGADMSYEVGEVGPAVRSAITRTCTRAFAAALLAHRATPPPGVSARQVRQRVVGVVALERLPGAAVVLATVRSPGGRGHPGAPGAFELRLVPRPGGWRVAGLSVV